MDSTRTEYPMRAKACAFRVHGMGLEMNDCPCAQEAQRLGRPLFSSLPFPINPVMSSSQMEWRSFLHFSKVFPGQAYRELVLIRLCRKLRVKWAGEKFILKCVFSIQRNFQDFPFSQTEERGVDPRAPGSLLPASREGLPIALPMPVLRHLLGQKPSNWSCP